MNYVTENDGHETVWYPEYARIEVMTQTDPDSVIAKRVQGGWASWAAFFPDESVLHFEAVHILTPAELSAAREGAWNEPNSDYPQYARLMVVDGDTTSFPIGERGFCGWHSGVMFYPDVFVERYTPLVVLTTAQVKERLAKVWRQGRDHGATYPYGERGPATDDNPYSLTVEPEPQPTTCGCERPETCSNPHASAK